MLLQNTSFSKINWCALMKVLSCRGSHKMLAAEYMIKFIGLFLYQQFIQLVSFVVSEGISIHLMQYQTRDISRIPLTCYVYICAMELIRWSFALMYFCCFRLHCSLWYFFAAKYKTFCSCFQAACRCLKKLGLTSYVQLSV